MNKKWIEIGVSSGLVLMMAVLLLLVQLAAPDGLKSTGFALVVLLYMLLMGAAGFKLIEMS